MQRSGSCALSSLIGALLYISKSEETFYMYRLKIGHALVKSFLSKAKVNEKFKTIIKDGFETNGRNFMQVIGSSLAQKTLEYLEFALPQFFKHAGLIGSERYKWIFEKKEAANQALMEADPVVYESLRISIQLINEIMAFLKENPIFTASNDIVLTDEMRGKFHPIKSNYVPPNISGVQNLSKDFYSFLKGTCDLSEDPLKNFNDFYEAFAQFKDIKEASIQQFHRALNIFQRAHNLIKDDSWLGTISEEYREKLIDLQSTCLHLVQSFAGFKDKMISFDFIVLLTYLQKLSWQLAVAYDKLLENKIGLEELAAPLTIQSVLFGFKPVNEKGKEVNVLAGNLKQFIIHNSFDQRNVGMFMELLEQDTKDNGKERFMGPEKFCDVNESSFKPKLPYFGKNRDMYFKMIANPDVDSIFEQIKKNPDPKNKWKNTEPVHGKFIIVFSKGQERLNCLFPHYYNLMNTLASVRIGSIETKSLYNNWTSGNIKEVSEDPDEVKNTCFSYLNYAYTRSSSYLGIIQRDNLYSFDINNSYRKYENAFYNARHSLALPRTMNIISLETWLNYIKSSSSAKLFDSTYFQYITDHLLNLPKFDEQQKVMFPIDDFVARSIIEGLSRLIRVSLETIKVKNQQLSGEKRKTLILRTVNVSVILTRFISRIDSENILTGSECAKALAEIYNFMIPFACLKSDFLLAEPEVSRINFALAHICTVPIRNSFTFMNNVRLGTIQKGLRKTLKRYHWFAAKKGFLFNGVGTSISDDQFNYGRSESPMTREETGMLKGLFIAYFLPSLVSESSKLNVNEYTFSFNYALNLLRIQNLALGIDVILNIWSGAVVFNGLCMINNSVFINSEQFQNFFPPEDLPLVSNGLAAEAAGKSIYALPNYKGTSYLITRMIKESMFSKQIVMNIHGKWYGHWYEFKTYKEIKNIIQNLNLEYDWIVDGSQFFMRDYGQRCREIIIILKNDSNPVMRLINDESLSTIKVVIDGFTKDTEWTIQTKESTESKLFQRHFESFTHGEYIVGKDENGLFVIICMNLRLPEDMRRPIVFREKTGSVGTEFEILNTPKTNVCLNQSLRGSSCLPGGLVIISDSKKALILPNASKKEESKKTIQAEKIPILEDEIAPQAREHKLLLAYYFILQFEFNAARKLLTPSSILHNETFSIKEVKIMNWIQEIDLEAPEALALKLFVYLHFETNRKKFPIDHSNNDLQIIQALNINNYLFALREMSEKYYIFLVFPEVLKEPLFSSLFGEISKNHSSLPNPELKRFSPYVYISSYFIPSGNFEIGREFTSTFIKLIIDEKHDQLKLASKLMVRRNHKNYFNDGQTTALICYLNEPELWSEFKEQLFLLKDKSLSDNDRKAKAEESEEIFKKVIEICAPKYSNHFHTDMNQCSDTTVTSLETLKNTFEAEINRLKLGVVNDNIGLITGTDLVAPIDIQTLVVAETALRNKLSNEIETRKLVNFDEKTLKSSSILAKLKKSIEDFVNEKGCNSQTEILLGNDSKTSLEDLRVLFSDRISTLSSVQDNYAAELAAIVNANPCSAAIGSILDLMHQRKAKTFESLYACYFKDSLVCIQKKLPHLSLEQCIEIKEKAKIFYSRQVLINYFDMLNTTVENFLKLAEKSEPVSADDLNIFCDELSKINDFNSRMKDPVIMNFEFRSQKYRLKPEQVKDVELLTAKDQITNLFFSIVIQRMMAAGKTLVLGTTAVVKKALDSLQLSILVPPSALYQSNTTAMQARTYKYFKKKGINFIFPRFVMPTKDKPDKTEILKNYLKTVIELITDTMTENNYMILSPDTLHSYLNSYIEALLSAENNWSDEYKEILRSYGQIYRIFKQRGSIILDEIDMTMDPKKELNFPTQETEPYNMVAVSMLTDIMEFMVFDEDIIKSGLRIHSNNQASLTAANYRECIKLVLKYIERQLSNSSSLWYSLVFGSNSHDASVKQIMDFLSSPNMAGEKDWIIEFHDSGNEIIADALIIVKQQLYCHMEHALKGTVNQNFGSAGSLRPEIKFAVPYAAANTPSAASVFADRWETLLKTLLMISASPCSRDIAKDFIEYAKIAIPSESSIADSLQTTVTYRNMKLILPENLCPLSLDSKNSLHVEAMQQALELRTPAAIRLLFTFYITQVFDKMTFPTEQITSNALNVASMFNSVQGYSGTIDNVNILPQHVVKDAYEDNMKNEKNNGGISLKLVRDCDDGKVEELNETAFTTSAEEMVRELLSLYPSENVSAIIDAGAFFKNFKNILVAKAILEACSRVKAVLYYDEDSNQLEFLRSNEGSYTRGILETSDPDDIRKATEVEIDERFTFYDQRHITGSDILQPKTAHAIMTTGPRVLLRDILQGALRMRQFMTSQKVHLVTTKASRNFYSSKIDKENVEMKVSDVLTLGALNEEEKQEHENVRLAFGKINAEIRAFVLDEISRALLDNFENSKQFVLEMTSSAKSLFLRSIREVPLNWLLESKNENSTETLKLFSISRLHPLKKLMNTNNLTSNIELQQRFNSLKKRIRHMISPENKRYYYNKETIKTPISLDDGSEVQQQTLTLTMIDLNMDTLMEKCYSYSEYTHNYDLMTYLKIDERSKTLTFSNSSSYISLRDLYEKYDNSLLKPYLDNTLVTSGDRIGVSKDLVNVAKTSYWRNKDDEYPIFSQFTFEGTHFLVQLFNDNLKVLLISSNHASNVLNHIKDYNSSKFWLCDLSGSVTATNDPETTKGGNVLDFIPQIDNFMFDLLAFNGSLPQILANPKLKAIYDNWLNSENFEKRAIFLRLRMKVLMSKEEEMFEIDDRNLGLLKKYSLGIQNAAESFVDGYPKPFIDTDFETAKMTLLNITLKNQQAFYITNNVPINFNLDAEIRQLLNITGDESSNVTEPDFVSEEAEATASDEDFDVREIPIITRVERPIIQVEEYPLAEKKVYQEEVKKEQVKEVSDTEIFIDDSMADYNEPALTELEPVKMTEITVDLGSKSEKAAVMEKVEAISDIFEAEKAEIHTTKEVDIDEIEVRLGTFEK